MKDAVYFSEHCEECGGIFTVDQLESAQDHFRLRVSIEYTGEHGTLTLHLDGCRAFLLDSEQAMRWSLSYQKLRVQHRLSNELRRITETSCSLLPEDETSLPKALQPGETWTGWLKSTRPLPEEAVAMLSVIGMFREEIPDRFLAHFSHDGRRPFISLQGQDVTIEPLSPPALAAAKISGFVRTQWNPANARLFIGGIAGFAVDLLTLGTGVIGWVAGCFLGYQAVCRYYAARNRRP